MTVIHTLKNLLRCFGTLSLTIALVLAGNLFVTKQAAHAAPSISKITAETAHTAYGSLPTTFIANDGQLDASVRYEMRSSAGHLFFTPQGITLALTAPANAPAAAQHIKSEVDAAPQTSISVRVSFDGANPNPVLDGADQLPGIANFFIGSDPTQWHTNVPTYAGVAYHDLYPGIDLSYTGHVGVLKGTYTVASGTDPALIRWRYTGANATHIDATTGNLLIDAPAGVRLIEQVPEAWQVGADGTQHIVTTKYTLTEDGTAQFTVGKYDQALPLVIDPGLVYSTYLGGSGSGQGVAVDSSGNAYVVGATGSTKFSTTIGAAQTIFGGGYNDVFMTKLNVAGNALVYSTYLGGSGDDFGSAIAVDNSGNAYVTGSTTSANFPTTTGVYQTTYGFDTDAFVTKLNATGNALMYSTYLGGIAFDEGYGIAVNSSGNAYVTGFTNGANFPITAGAYQTTFYNSVVIFVTELNTAGSALVYSTYLGGNSGASSYGIAVDSSGNVYVTGVTSDSFPTTAGAYQTTLGGNMDTFIAKLNAAGSALVYSTYLGGSRDDFGYGIAVDRGGSAYVTGYTQSANFPTTIGAAQTTFGGSYDAFVSKLNAAGSALVYSTYLGGSRDDFGYGIAVDRGGSAYVTGFTASANFPTTPGDAQTTFGGSYDAFVSKLNAVGSALYSTYLGGSDTDEGLGIAVDSSGNAYVTGFTGNSFPTTMGAYQPTSSSTFNTFVTKLDMIPATPTTTPSNSATPTLTPSVTNTSTSTLTTTATSISTPTVTFTLSATATSSITMTSTASVTTTSTVTPTNTPPSRKPDTIGVFRPRTATFYLRGSNTQGFADLTVQYGATNSYPVVGDWTGSGITTFGVFDPSNGQFQLRNSNTPGAADETFVLGIAGDQPFAGHWQANAVHDGVGVFRPSNGLIYLKNDLGSGFADYTMVLGIPGDVGVAGDWDGNGISSPGVFRPNTVTFYLSDQVVNGSVFGDHAVTLGYAGDVPFAGDWSAQGHAGVGVFRPTNGLLYLKNDLTTGFADVNIVYGIPNDIPIAGHWGISSPAPHNSVIVPNTALPATATATPTQPALRLTQPDSYDG